MDSLRDQGDAGAGALAGRKPWATPRVIVSVGAAGAEAKGDTIQAEIIVSLDYNATPS